MVYEKVYVKVYVYVYGLFALFCTILNIFAKNSHHFSWAWDLQLARNLHSVPVANIDFFSSYDKFSFHILV